jgi:quercetin dioxygenase-like cupin family protein
MYFEKAGDTELGHTHPFDHMTLLAKGSLRVTTGGKASVFNAPHIVFIKAELEHELVALEDGTTAYCIHALRGDNRTGDIIDPDMVPAGACAPCSVAALAGRPPLSSINHQKI